jgi:hypothetical protein
MNNQKNRLSVVKRVVVNLQAHSIHNPKNPSGGSMSSNNGCND